MHPLEEAVTIYATQTASLLLKEFLRHWQFCRPLARTYVLTKFITIWGENIKGGEHRPQHTVLKYCIFYNLWTAQRFQRKRDFILFSCSIGQRCEILVIIMTDVTQSVLKPMHSVGMKSLFNIGNCSLRNVKALTKIFSNM